MDDETIYWPYSQTPEEMLKEKDTEIERQRLAQTWYAEKHRYENSIAIDRGDGSYDYSVEIIEDEGATACNALAATENKP